MHGANGACRLALGRAETAEVMLAQQIQRSLLHGRQIQGLMHPPHTPVHNRRTHPGVAHHVNISARHRREPGMKRIGHCTGPLHRNRCGQQGIDAAHPRFHAPLGYAIQMHDLSQGMHSGVGAPCANRRLRLRREPRQSGFKHVLHGTAVRLRLPAQPGRPVVRHAQRHASHISSCWQALRRWEAGSSRD